MKHDKTRVLTQSRTSSGSCLSQAARQWALRCDEECTTEEVEAVLSADALVLLSVQYMVAGMSVNDSDCHESCDD